MTDTAHDRYEEQVHAGNWNAYNDVQAEAQRQQIAGLRAERDALTAALTAKGEQIAGLAEVVAVPKLGLLDTGRIPQP